MNKKSIALLLSLVAILLGACAKESQPGGAPQPSEPPISSEQSAKLGLIPTSGVNAGRLHIKVSRSTAQMLSQDLSRGGSSNGLRSFDGLLGSALRSIGATDLEPLFPIDPRWEKRMRAEGLDQWYILRFDKRTELRSAASSLIELDEIERVESSHQIQTFATKVTERSPRLMADDGSDNGMPYNDPGLIDQWHYSNDGARLERSVRGADINLFEAWAIETGRPEVIVSVVDGGIDIKHEDLKDNLWVNKGEIAGNNIDDDGNGFVDDIHGWNFNVGRDLKENAEKGKEIVPDGIGHGTHVAGTVGARTNNRLGVAGVAGGNGSTNSGVRLMSCQTFAGERSSISLSSQEMGKDEEYNVLIASADRAVRAIVYGANNGAVISQNSWGYRFPGVDQIPDDVKAAIDYFRKWAGCDEHGNQLPSSPMKGGVVIFAAGNDDTDYLCFPAAYEATIAVSAMAPNWVRASYTNRGAWVDIMAPGGDDVFRSESKGENAGQVYSTLPHGRYGYMAGTSMACPHVSGIAALAISKYGVEQRGFTAEKLENILLTSLRPQSINTNNVASERGRLGRGYIDAGVIFATDEKIAPNTIEQLSSQVAWTSARFEWTAVADKDDRQAISYRVYHSKTPINDDNIKDLPFETIDAISIAPGATMDFVVKNLEDDTDYYVGILSLDRWGNIGKLKVEKIHTKLNHPPVFSYQADQAVRVSVRERAKLSIPLTDPDDHSIAVRFSGEARGVSHTYKDGVLSVSIASIAPEGQYTIQVEAKDQFGKTSQLEIPFVVYKYIEPSFASDLDGLPISLPVASVSGEPRTFDLKSILRYSQGANISYVVSSANEQVLKVSVDREGILSLRGLAVGKSQVRITISDGISQPITKTFEVRVAQDSESIVYSVYPTPAVRELNIVFAQRVTSADIEIYSLSGRKVYSERLTPSAGRVKCDIRKLSAGTYTLKAITALGTSRHTFVKL